MTISRRDALMATLFGAGGIGLRALATGLPAAFLVNPRKAMASPACTAQYFIFNTSGGGDPIGQSVPGTYNDPKIIHPPSWQTGTSLTLNGKAYLAAQPWSTLPQAVLDRTQFWHIMTGTPVHPKEPQVLELMGMSPNNEMFPSLLAKAVAPCLNTIQPQPLSIGAASPTEALEYDGSILPVIPPIALKDTLANPTGPLTQLQSIRDQTMNSLYQYFQSAGGATPSQKAYLDQMALSQTQIRNIKQSLLGSLSSIQDNSVASQITAAITLIQMNVAPVIAIHIPFGGDNHSDKGLATETSETTAGVASIASLMSQLASPGANGQPLTNQVTFVTLNVFGRSMLTNGGPTTSAADGRAHNANWEMSMVIGQAFPGGVIGAVAPTGGDYGCTNITSATGAGSSSGDIQASDTLAAFAQTMLASVGGNTSQITSPTGKVIQAALAS
jgi:hypothetical protein